ncbi:unnamed protein product [Ascophyllum nodosum]
MKSEARFVARGFGQQPGVDYFDSFAPTPAVSSTECWKLQPWDVKQVFVNTELDMEEHMKLPNGVGLKSGKVVVERAL